MDISKHTLESKLEIKLDGISSSKFNLINISKEDGAYNESLLGTRSLSFENLEQNGHFILNAFSKEQVTLNIKLAYKRQEIVLNNEIVEKDVYMSELHEWLYGTYENRYEPRKLEFVGVDGHVYGYVNGTPNVISDGKYLMMIEFEFYCTTSYFLKDYPPTVIGKGETVKLDIAKDEIMYTTIVIDNRSGDNNNFGLKYMNGKELTLNGISSNDIVTLNITASSVKSNEGVNYYNRLNGHTASVVLSHYNNELTLTSGSEVTINGQLLKNY